MIADQYFVRVQVQDLNYTYMCLSHSYTKPFK